jgi:cytochrome c553
MMRKEDLAPIMLCLVVLAACGGGGAGEPPAPSQEETASSASKVPEPPTAEAVARGAAVWEAEGCAVCHGEEGEGGEIAPPLLDLAANWTPADLAAYLADPVVDPEENPRLASIAEQYEIEMPGVQESSGTEVTDLVAFLLSRGD